MNTEQWDKEIMEQCGMPIRKFAQYGILENGTVRNNWSGKELKPDKYGCVCIRPRRNGRCKTFSIARLVAINWLGMPDDKEHMAYKKDVNGGFEVDNIAWGTKHEVLSLVHKRRKKQEEPPKMEEEEIYEEMIE